MQKKKSENWKWLNDSFASKQNGDEFQGGRGHLAVVITLFPKVSYSLA